MKEEEREDGTPRAVDEAARRNRGLYKAQKLEGGAQHEADGQHGQQECEGAVGCEAHFCTYSTASASRRSSPGMSSQEADIGVTGVSTTYSSVSP